MRAGSAALWMLHMRGGTRRLGGELLTRAWIVIPALLLLGIALGIVPIWAEVEVPRAPSPAEISHPTESDLPAVPETSMMFHEKDHFKLR